MNGCGEDYVSRVATATSRTVLGNIRLSFEHAGVKTWPVPDTGQV